MSQPPPRPSLSRQRFKGGWVLSTISPAYMSCWPSFQFYTNYRRAVEKPWNISQIKRPDCTLGVTAMKEGEAHTNGGKERASEEATAGTQCAWHLM